MANATTQANASTDTKDVLWLGNLGFTKKFKARLAQALGSEVKAEEFLASLIGVHVLSGFGPDEEAPDAFGKVIKSKAGNARVCIYAK